MNLQTILIISMIFILSSCGFDRTPRTMDRMADTTEKMALSTDKGMTDMNENMKAFAELTPHLKELLISLNKMTPQLDEMLNGFSDMTPELKEMMLEMLEFIKKINGDDNDTETVSSSTEPLKTEDEDIKPKVDPDYIDDDDEEEGEW